MTDRSLQRLLCLSIIGFGFGTVLSHIDGLGQLQPSNALTPTPVKLTPIDGLGQLQPSNALTSTPVKPTPVAPGVSQPTSKPTTVIQPPQQIAPIPPWVQPPVTPTTTRQETLTIKAVGDIVPATNYPNNRLPGDANDVLPTEVRGYLERADLVFGNFESSLTNYPTSRKAVGGGLVFAFRTPPEYAQIFGAAGFDVFNIANNHAMDFGQVGLQDTVNHLAAVGIETVGHKNQILYQEVNDLKVAFLGFCPYSFYNSVNDLATAKALVEEADRNADIVIISMHAGAEGTGALHVRNQQEFFFGENRGNPVQFARMTIDAGADLVLGHSPHVPRAIELYNGKLIAYSLGNFLGYRTLSTAAQAGYSMILDVKMNRDGDFVGGRVIPVHMDSQGIPQIDQYFRTVGLLRYLIKSDFPETPIEISQRGEIVLKNSQTTTQ